MDIIVYDETTRADWVDLDPVQADLSQHGVQLDVRVPLPRPRADEAWYPWLAWMLAWSKVRSPDRPIPPNLEPKPLEVDREEKALHGQANPPGPLYDGKRLLEAFHGPLPEEERSPDAGPIVILTDRMIGTFEGTRYHVRFLTTGHPNIVSPPGLIDGPARAREYYMAKQMLGQDPEGIEGMGDDDHLTKDDDRVPTAIASAFLQVAKYHVTGDPFCEDDGCRLSNPHWQADLLDTMATGRLCKEHEAWLHQLA